MAVDYVPKMRGVSLSRLWKRYISLKSNTSGDTKTPLFQGQSLVDARWRTINWVFFHALVRNVGSIVPTIADALHQNALNQQTLNSEYGNSEVDQLDPKDKDLDETALSTGKDTLNEDTFSLDNGDDYDDSVVDEDREHINALIQLTGNPNKYFDTERWCRMLLWTIHMYVDGYCGDYTFQYGKPYAPSYDAVVEYIDQHDGDPFVLQAPVSSVEALLPHQTAIALLPKPYLHLLPRPIQRRLEDKDVLDRVFPNEDEVNISEVIRLTSEVPLSEYSEQERKFLVHGEPFLVRRAFQGEPGFINKNFYRSVPKPGPKFRDVRRNPVVVRKAVGRTTEPPCYPWPAGGFENMLQLPYIAVAGHPLYKVNAVRNDAIQVSSGNGTNTPNTTVRTANQDVPASPPDNLPSKNNTEQTSGPQNRESFSDFTRSNVVHGKGSDGARASPKTQRKVDRGGRRGRTDRGKESEGVFGSGRRTRGRYSYGKGGSGGRGDTSSRSGWNTGTKPMGVKRARDKTPNDGCESG